MSSPKCTHKAMLTPPSNVLWLTYKLACTFLLFTCLMNDQVVQCIDHQQDEEPQVTISHHIHKDAEFTCSFARLGKRKLIWRRLADPFPISVGSTKFAPYKQYQISRENSTSYRLVIKDVGIKDAGEYECRVSGLEHKSEIITLNVKGGPNRPYLKQTKTVVTAEEGDTVLMPCEVENLNDKLVLWKNDKNEVVTLRKKNHISDRRFKVIHNLAPEWSLQIKKVMDKDYGHYTCLINSNPVITRTVLLKRAVTPEFPPTLMIDSQDKVNVIVEAGQTATLTCNFRAKPPATVTWYQRIKVNNKSVKKEIGFHSTLTLRSVSPEQSGTYFCVGKNGLKPYGRGRKRLVVNVPITTVPPTTTTTMLVPTGPVAPHMYHKEARVPVKRGRDVTLTCLAIGQPLPTIYWNRHGHRLKKDHKYDMETSFIGRFKATSQLHINSLSSRDFGTYKCISYNQLGVESIDFELYDG